MRHGVEAARVATEADIEHVATLARQAIEELRHQKGGALWAVREARAEPLEDSLRAAMADDVHLVLVGTLDDCPIGYAVAHLEHVRDDRPLAVIDDLYVEPDARGVGVGEALMDTLIEWARRHHCRGIDGFTLPGSRHTKNFFEAHGLTARAILVHRDLSEPDAST